MRRHRPLFLLLAVSLAFALGCATGEEDTGDDADWVIEDVVVGTDDLNYAEVSGTVTLDDDLAGFGTLAEVRFYTDDSYTTLIKETSDIIGGDLQKSGNSQVFSITDYEVYVQPALDGYDTVCVEFRADDSDFPKWTELGCVP